jgi:hypothetical protein
MLDPRIYRAGFVAVLLAVIVFAFSLQDEPGALRTTLSPIGVNGAAALSTMNDLAARYPIRTPGSYDDDQVAGDVAHALHTAGPRHPFTVTTHMFTADTSAGTRTLETVTGLSAGLSQGTIAIVATRDGRGPASLSGTALLEQLAQILGAQSLNHSILLVSTSGAVGAAGTAEVAAQLAATQVDAVIVLGDLAAKNASKPLIVPWSDSRLIAPPVLSATLAAALHAQAGLRSGSAGVPAQLARLAFPLTTSPQGPFGSDGLPAVLLSVSGERGPNLREPLFSGPARLTAIGEAIVETVNALDAAPAVPPPSTFLAFDGKNVPYWAIRALVLALLLPVLLVMVDGVARARRRGHTLVGSVGWVLAAAVPFLLAAAVVRAAKLASVIAAAPPGPVPGGAIPLRAAGIGLLVVVAIVLVGAFLLLRPLIVHAAARAAGEPRRRGAHDEPPVGEGGGPALLLVACLATLAIWLRNPFAAALVIPALHLWVWVVDTDLQLPRPLLVAMLIVGLAPPALVVAYYAHAFSLGPADVLWNGALLIAGGQVGPAAALAWSVVLGCLASAVVIAVSSRRHQREHPEAITVRGPITYAGPGSLGGTQSAIRR